VLHQFIHRHDGEENKRTIKYVSLGHNSLSFKNVLFICDSLCKGPFVSEYVFSVYFQLSRWTTFSDPVSVISSMYGKGSTMFYEAIADVVDIHSCIHEHYQSSKFTGLTLLHLVSFLFCKCHVMSLDEWCIEHVYILPKHPDIT